MSQHLVCRLFVQKMPERTVQHVYSKTIYSTVRQRNWRTHNMKKCTNTTTDLKGNHLMYLAGNITYKDFRRKS